MLSPEKVAMPLTAATVVMPDRVPLPALVPMPTEIELVALVMVCPAACWMATWTAGAHAVPAVTGPGWTTNASRLAGAAVTEKGVLVAAARPGEETARV